MRLLALSKTIRAHSLMTNVVQRRGFKVSHRVHEKTDSVYVIGPRNGSVESTLLIGLGSSLSRYSSNVGFFRPIEAQPWEDYSGSTADPHVALMSSVFELPDDPSKMTGISYSSAVKYLHDGKEEAMCDRIMEKYLQYKADKEFVLIEGGSLSNELITFELNTKIANSLEAPVMISVDVEQYKSGEEAVEASILMHNELKRFKGDFAGIVLNKGARTTQHDLLRYAREKYDKHNMPFAGILPKSRILGSVRLNEIGNALKAKPLYGMKQLDEADIEISTMIVGTLQFPSLLKHLNELPASAGAGPLIFTSGDRLDVLAGLMFARDSVNMPTIAGIVLTGGHEPPKFWEDIIRGMPKSRQMMPVMQVEHDTFTTSKIASNIKGHLLPSSKRKIQHSIVLWDDNIDQNVISKLIQAEKTHRMTPKLFQHKLVQQARMNKKHIVLPEGHDPRILEAAAELLGLRVVDITLLGDPEHIMATATNLGVDISLANLVDPAHSPMTGKYADLLYCLRKEKGMQLDQAKDMAQDATYYGTLMVQAGDADGMVSGAIHTTANTIRPALQIIKSLPDRPVVSSVFFMLLPDKVLVYGDCAINVNPTSEELAVIAISSAETAHAFGLDPRVAMLSYATGDSNKGPMIEKVRTAAELAQKLAPHLAIEGPIQYDAAVDPDIAKSKIKGESKVAGKANVLIFPDLNTGNNTYKAVQQSTGAIAMGPVLQGLRKPVNDLSRGCTILDIVNTVVMTALQSANMTKE
eukprot:CFRG6704T1